MKPYAVTLNCGCIHRYEVEEIGSVYRCPEHGTMMVLPMPYGAALRTGIPGHKLVKVEAIRKPRPDLIACLEDMLERARRGEIERLLVLGYNGREGGFRILHDAVCYEMLGVLTCVTLKIAQEIEAGAFVPDPVTPAG